MAPSRQ